MLPPVRVPGMGRVDSITTGSEEFGYQAQVACKK
jgi:hypothetical protein